MVKHLSPYSYKCPDTGTLFLALWRKAVNVSDPDSFNDDQRTYTVYELTHVTAWNTLACSEFVIVPADQSFREAVLLYRDILMENE